MDVRAPHPALHPSKGRASYLFNATIEGIEDADALMIVGANPRIEAPVLNARIRKRWLMGDFPVAVIGENVDLTYGYHYAGAGAESLEAFTTHDAAKAERPMMIVGQGALNRADGGAILAMAAKAAQSLGVVKDGWNGFSVLHTDASLVGGLDIGFVPGEGGHDTAAMLGGALEVLFLLGADEHDLSDADAFTVYIGTHGDRGAHGADVILPGATYTEKAGTYVNTEGRPQPGRRAGFPPGDAREDWAILRALSAVLGHTLPFNAFDGLRAALYDAHPGMANVDVIEAADPATLATLAAAGGTLDKAPFASPIENFYLTNPIARASKVMAECSALAMERASAAAGATGTDG